MFEIYGSTRETSDLIDGGVDGGGEMDIGSRPIPTSGMVGDGCSVPFDNRGAFT